MGALLGIGGGVLLIPILVLGFDLPIRVAAATSLVAVVATSTAAGSRYVAEGYTNMRLAMTLEVATTAGALTGGLTAVVLSERTLLLVFAGLLVLTAGLLFSGREAGEREVPPAGGRALVGEVPGRLAGSFVSPRTGEVVSYRAVRLPLGLAGSFVAGNASGLLGVGGGFLKVPVMRLAMGIPTRVAVGTSNFMIGVTAAAGLLVYLQKGFVFPLIAAPVALGVAGGALAGTRLGSMVPGRLLARALAVLLVAIGIQFLLRALGIWHG